MGKITDNGEIEREAKRRAIFETFLNNPSHTKSELSRAPVDFDNVQDFAQARKYYEERRQSLINEDYGVDQNRQYNREIVNTTWNVYDLYNFYQKQREIDVSYCEYNEDKFRERNSEKLKARMTFGKGLLKGEDKINAYAWLNGDDLRK